MISFAKIDTTKLVLWGVGGLIVYIAIKNAKASITDAAGAAGDFAVNALPYTNPITAPIALAYDLGGYISEKVKPSTTTGVKLTNNFNYYLKIHGGIDVYLAKKQSGTFSGKPYDANVDYKAIYNNQSGYGITDMLTLKPLRDLF